MADTAYFDYPRSSEMDYVHIIVTESLQSVKPVLVNAQA